MKKPKELGSPVAHIHFPKPNIMNAIASKSFLFSHNYGDTIPLSIMLPTRDNSLKRLPFS